MTSLYKEGVKAVPKHDFPILFGSQEDISSKIILANLQREIWGMLKQSGLSPDDVRSFVPESKIDVSSLCEDILAQIEETDSDLDPSTIVSVMAQQFVNEHFPVEKAVSNSHEAECVLPALERKLELSNQKADLLVEMLLSKDCNFTVENPDGTHRLVIIYYSYDQVHKITRLLNVFRNQCAKQQLA